MGTLGHERVGTAGLSITMRTDLDNMIAAAREHNPGALEDPDIRDRIARVWTQLELTRLLNARALSKVLKGEKTWPEVQLAKLQWSAISQTLAELAVDLLGPAGVLAKGAPDAVDGGRWARNYVWQRYTSIGAGTTEVQKNIIAERAIQLPRR
jgi:alkylation response protein AidB-like acyl-CoA dehydrogenase